MEVIKCINMTNPDRKMLVFQTQMLEDFKPIQQYIIMHNSYQPIHIRLLADPRKISKSCLKLMQEGKNLPEQTDLCVTNLHSDSDDPE